MLVVGAGPSGLAFALTCAAAGVKVRIVDSRDRRSMLGKATGVALGVWRRLEQLGVADAVLAEAIPMQHFAFYDDGQQVANVPVPAMEGMPPAFLYPQGELERHLEAALNNDGVFVEYGTRLVSLSQSHDCAEIGLSSKDGGMLEKCRVGWLIGADGAHSEVRRLLRAPFVGRDYPENWSVAEIATSAWSTDVQAKLYLDRTGVGLFLSQPCAGVVQGILNAPGVFARLEHQFSDAELRYERNFRVSLRRVPKPRVGRTWLIGDAAHVQSPVGGQGLNLAVWDGMTLAEALMKHDFSVESRLAARARKVLFFTDFDYRMLVTRNWLLRQLRNDYWRCAATHPNLAKWFFKIISGVW